MIETGSAWMCRHKQCLYTTSGYVIIVWSKSGHRFYTSVSSLLQFDATWNKDLSTGNYEHSAGTNRTNLNSIKHGFIVDRRFEKVSQKILTQYIMTQTDTKFETKDLKGKGPINRIQRKQSEGTKCTNVDRNEFQKTGSYQHGNETSNSIKFR